MFSKDLATATSATMETDKYFRLVVEHSEHITKTKQKTAVPLSERCEAAVFIYFQGEQLQGSFREGQVLSLQCQAADW